MEGITKQVVESRLAKGESLRSIARSFDVTHQALCWRREQWGCPKLRKARHPGKLRSGGRFVDKWGYVMLRTSNKPGAMAYTPEHVLVAEKMLGRKIRKGEMVHHINGLKSDNREGNLAVFSSRRAHKNCHVELERLAMNLVRSGHIVFRDDSYTLASE